MLKLDRQLHVKHEFYIIPPSNKLDSSYYVFLTSPLPNVNLPISRNIFRSIMVMTDLIAVPSGG